MKQRQRQHRGVAATQRLLAPGAEARVFVHVADQGRHAVADGPAGRSLAQRTVIPAHLDALEVTLHVAGHRHRFHHPPGLLHGEADPGHAITPRPHRHLADPFQQAGLVRGPHQRLVALAERHQRPVQAPRLTRDPARSGHHLLQRPAQPGSILGQPPIETGHHPPAAGHAPAGPPAAVTGAERHDGQCGQRRVETPEGVGGRGRSLVAGGIEQQEIEDLGAEARQGRVRIRFVDHGPAGLLRPGYERAELPRPVGVPLKKQNPHAVP